MRMEKEVKDRLAREQQLLFEIAMGGSGDLKEQMRVAGIIEALHWVLTIDEVKQ